MMRRIGSLCVGFALVLGAGCTPRAPGEREIEVKPLDPMTQARTMLQRYADGEAMSSEASTFPDLVAKVREKDAKKADILEKGLDDLQKAPPGARPGKAKELLKKLE